MGELGSGIGIFAAISFVGKLLIFIGDLQILKIVGFCGMAKIAVVVGGIAVLAGLGGSGGGEAVVVKMRGGSPGGLISWFSIGY